MENLEHLIIGMGFLILSSTVDSSSEVTRILLMMFSIYSIRQWYKGES